MMMQQFCSSLLKAMFMIGFVTNLAIAQAPLYDFEIDLRKVKKDQLTVNLRVNGLNQDKVTYYMPKIVPGTYSIADYGRFVEGLKAFDAEGKELAVKRANVNAWEISDATQLAMITYQIDDTWEGDGTDNLIFEPAGTDIEKDKSFVLNTFGVFGYFEGKINEPYRVKFLKPSRLYGATSMIATEATDSSDVFELPNYHELADAPIMYSVPDTAILKIGGADILVAVYSDNGVIDAPYIAKNIKEILTAQQAYLGGSLPIKKYAFIYYFSSKNSKSGMMGALEHSYSSFYYLPEYPKMFLTQTIKDIAAHEFFHIVTPLNIHSEQIHHFDYNSPEMSRHLWLYEGVTEYSASHMQVKYNLISVEEYFGVIKNKLTNSRSSYNPDLSFTEMSLGCLDEHKDQYGNVYEKGALIGMCLDILLLDYSEGKYGIQDMMQDLSKTYGKHRPFDDEQLFDQITTMTGQPKIREFFSKYVEGSERLPLAEVFEKVGYHYQEPSKGTRLDLGNMGIATNEDGQRYITSIPIREEMQAKYPVAQDDILLSFHDIKVNQSNFDQVLQDLTNKLENGEKFVIEVARKNKKGKLKSKKLKAQAAFENFRSKMTLEPMDNPTPRQQELLKAWIADVE